jgi:hypothetical protein
VVGQTIHMLGEDRPQRQGGPSEKADRTSSSAPRKTDRLPPFADGIEPFCLTLWSQQFWTILYRLCCAIALAIGDRGFSLSNDIVLAFDHLFECLVLFLFFSLFSVLVTMCVVNALVKGEIEDRSVRGPADGRSLV